MFNEINQNETYQWNVFSGDAELELIKNLKAGIRVNGNIRSYKKEVRLPQNIHGEVSEYTQDQSQLSDIQTQGRLTWSDHFVDSKLSFDAALFFEDRVYNLDELGAFTRDGLFHGRFLQYSRFFRFTGR